MGSYLLQLQDPVAEDILIGLKIVYLSIVQQLQPNNLTDHEICKEGTVKKTDLVCLCIFIALMFSRRWLQWFTVFICLNKMVHLIKVQPLTIDVGNYETLGVTGFQGI